MTAILWILLGAFIMFCLLMLIGVRAAVRERVIIKAITCIHCGQTLMSGDHAASIKTMKDHDLICPAHPLKIRLDGAREAMCRAQTALTHAQATAGFKQSLGFMNEAISILDKGRKAAGE